MNKPMLRKLRLGMVLSVLVLLQASPAGARPVADRNLAPAASMEGRVLRPSAAGAGGMVARLDRRIDRVVRSVRQQEVIADRLHRWYSCFRLMPVDQIGDPNHDWGFVYDELDGTGIDTRTALTRHVGRGRPDLVLLKVDRRMRCLSAAPDPNGTGADARMAADAAMAARRSARGLGASVLSPDELANRLERVEDRIDALSQEFDKFDEWESCLSWLPVTEYGDGVQNLGYHFKTSPETQQGQQVRLSALDIDGSEWDDPDYMLLAFLGRDRPFTKRECGNEPGESVDRSFAARHARVSVRRPVRHKGDSGAGFEDLRDDLVAAEEDIEDLIEPAQEFVQFDECMFTLGLQERGGRGFGYEFRDANGATQYLPALSLDISDAALPQFDAMAFPGEEAPQIECNEDASGEGTDE